MARTKGALGKKTIARQAGVVVNDGFAEAFSGVGTNRDRSSYARPHRRGLLDQQTLTDLYIADGFGRKIVDTVAEEMTRSGVELEDLEDDELSKLIDAKLDELDFMRHMNDAVRWSRLFGGAIMIFGLNDGGTLDVPLNPEGIESVEFLRVYDRWQATIQNRVNDPQSIDYGKPEMWLISPHDGGNPYKVHNSRVWMFDGESIPDRMRQQNQGWGASALQSCYDQLVRLGMSHQHVEMLLERSQQAIHKIPQLANTLRAPGGEQMIQKRVDVVDMVRGILNTIVVDGDEDYSFISSTMAGYPDVLDRFAEALAAVSGIPVSVLMGRSQGGLNASDKASLDTWYARIESMWNDILRKPEDRIISYIIMAERGAVPDYKLCMRPLGVMSDKEEAEIDKLKADARKVQADADGVYLDRGVLDPDEVRGTVSEFYNIAEGSAAPGLPEPEEPDPVI